MSSAVRTTRWGLGSYSSGSPPGRGGLPRPPYHQKGVLMPHSDRPRVPLPTGHKSWGKPWGQAVGRHHASGKFKP